MYNTIFFNIFLIKKNGSTIHHLSQTSSNKKMPLQLTTNSSSHPPTRRSSLQKGSPTLVLREVRSRLSWPFRRLVEVWLVEGCKGARCSWSPVAAHYTNYGGPFIWPLKQGVSVFHPTKLGSVFGDLEYLPSYISDEILADMYIFRIHLWANWPISFPNQKLRAFPSQGSPDPKPPPSKG